MFLISQTSIPIIIVSYRNSNDVLGCLKAIQRLVADPEFDVYICENGGPAIFDNLISTLIGSNGPCELGHPINLPKIAPRFVQIEMLTLRGTNARVVVAEANENLGYAGAINAWLRILMEVPGWPGTWILNPDTEPAPRALFELVAWSQSRGRGMVGSRIVTSARPDLIHSRGLRWRRLHSSTEAVDYLASAEVEPDPNSVERCIDAPSGASVYVTRECLNKIGLMDERYFLYFEDLDWGYQAKKFGGVGYAFKSIVLHHVGTSIGTARKDSVGSNFSVYLDFRNRIHFIRKHHRGWLLWSLVVLLVQALRYAIKGSFGNMRAAFAGIFAGITGETGRPDHIIDLRGSFDRN